MVRICSSNEVHFEIRHKSGVQATAVEEDGEFIVLEGSEALTGTGHVQLSYTRRGRPRRLDYLLRYQPDVPIAVVEAKASYKTAAEGMQQAKLYASMLALKFAYASNGEEILEFDFFTGTESVRVDFPTPGELWERHKAGQTLDQPAEEIVLTPGRADPEQPLRYYQEAAVLRAVEAIASGKRRTLLTLCTGAGKTPIAFHIAWRLHAARWTAIPGRLRARILFLADRDARVERTRSGHGTAFPGVPGVQGRVLCSPL